MITKEIILRQLKTTSNEIANKFDRVYYADLDIFANELRVSYEILNKTISDKRGILPDNDFQGALLYWTALNSILSALELLRRGYTKEPQMIIRNVLEIFAVAYDFHVNPERYKKFILDPKKFDSSKSISEAQKVHAIIGQWYGMLSEAFTHVGPLHILPHKVTDGLCVGGMFDPNDQAVININIAAIMGTLDVLNSLLELTFIKYIPTSRFWERIDAVTYKYTPDKERMERVMKRMGESIASLSNGNETRDIALKCVSLCLILWFYADFWAGK